MRRGKQAKQGSIQGSSALALCSWYRRETLGRHARPKSHSHSRPHVVLLEEELWGRLWRCTKGVRCEVDPSRDTEVLPEGSELVVLIEPLRERGGVL